MSRGEALIRGAVIAAVVLGSPRRSLLFDPKFSVWLDRITLMRDRNRARHRHRQAPRRSTRPSIFLKRDACGGWFDIRDLGAVLDHEGPLPHPACDQAQ